MSYHIWWVFILGLLTVYMSQHTGRCVCCRFSASLHVCGWGCIYCGLL